MPRKKSNLPANKKRLIATRLMQISLLVDDYLYQQKPMSERSAVAYINEIANYKDKCFQDARSLQVIDKLTRCITAIIQEQQELQGAGEDDINAPQAKVNDTNVITASCMELESAKENDNNLMLSPVYSEIDEDFTQIPQYYKVGNYTGLTASYIAIDLDNNKDYSNQAEIVPLGMKENETDSTANLQNRDPAGISLGMETVSEVINLCEEEISELIKNHTSFRHEPEFSIQKAISNLSIRDLEETFTPFSQQCSQSILDNLNTQNSTFQAQDTMVPMRNYDNIVKPSAILQKTATDMISFRHGPTKIVLPTTKQKAQVQDKHKKPVKKYTKKIQKKETVYTKTTAPKKQRQTKRNNTKAVNACEINATNEIERNTKNHKATNKKLLEAKDLSIKEKPLPEVYTHKSKPSMQGHQKDSINMKTPTYQNIQITASTNTNIMSHDQSENAVAPIQNKIKTTYVQNLSWVENLRFVREIQVEEFEPFTDEGFWENYDLPAKFNEDDFNY